MGIRNMDLMPFGKKHVGGGVKDKDNQMEASKFKEKGEAEKEKEGMRKE